MRRSESTKFMNCQAKKGEAYVPTECEHIANICTHAMWVLPSLAGMLWMMHLASGHLQFFVTFLYGLALFSLFAVSTTFHALAYCGDRFKKLREFFHIGDRAVIYMFIAASYTPWLTLKEHNTACLQTLFIVWLAAILGIAYQYTFHEKYKWLETVFYLMIGVVPSVVVLEMSETTGLHEVAIGGGVYIAGVVFFKCDGVIPFAHAIWHCFVFLGALIHFNAVCRYLLGPGPHLVDLFYTQFSS